MSRSVKIPISESWSITRADPTRAASITAAAVATRSWASIISRSALMISRTVLDRLVCVGVSPAAGAGRGARRLDEEAIAMMLRRMVQCRQAFDPRPVAVA